ncbi:NUDIX hydrolase [Nocardiopsis terrae]|uniref:ADP-ribose pyrophosphatase YjhB (NUDIX family) n=1 Tax=Nocardiopsis terrae TaxID=372655 RepID=A0ABR9HAK6_9ACTN|nr:NUDIX domain-containing protein [Nocardiopsis terrae]MBE1456062.1 ADP-ribose pyrophosphatase YjhB (NUDIX family) [Nocardiopsis terrae]GHC96072.1 NUDIX hydrolase [Nocardiopsis terrae]
MPVPEFLRKLRRHVGHDLLPLVGVTAVVLDGGGRVLLHRRSDDGRWATPGGILEPGEQPARAVVREVREETGVLVEVERLATVIGQEPHTYPNGDQVQFLDLAFRCRPVGGELRVDGDESLDVGWFAPDRLPRMADRILERIRCAREPGGEPHYER